MLYPHDARGVPRASPAASTRSLVVEEKLPVPGDRAARRALRHGRRAADRRQARRARRAAAAAESATSTPTRSRVALARARSGGACGSTRVDARVALIEARRVDDRAHAADAGAHAVLLLGLPAQHLDAPTRTTRSSAPASAATRWSLLDARGQGRRSPASRRWAARARSGSASQPFTDADALRPERRRRHVPPLGLAGDPLRGRRRARTSPTSCSTTTPSR